MVKKVKIDVAESYDFLIASVKTLKEDSIHIFNLPSGNRLIDGVEDRLSPRVRRFGDL